MRYLVAGGLAVNLHGVNRWTRIPLVSIEDLIAMKTGTGRLQDQSDIAALRALAGPRADGSGR